MSWPIVLDEVTKVGKDAALARLAAKPRIYPYPPAANRPLTHLAISGDYVYLVTGASSAAVVRLNKRTRVMEPVVTMGTMPYQVACVGNLLYCIRGVSLWSVNLQTGATTALANNPGGTGNPLLIALPEYPDYLYLMVLASTNNELRRYKISTNTWDIASITLGGEQSGRMSYYDGTYLYLNHQGMIDRYNPATNTIDPTYLQVGISDEFFSMFAFSGYGTSYLGNTLGIMRSTVQAERTEYLSVYQFVVDGTSVKVEVLPFEQLAFVFDTDATYQGLSVPYASKAIYDKETDTLYLMDQLAVVIYEGVKALDSRI